VPERRGGKRVPAQLKVWCEGDGFSLLARTTNVSRRGLFVHTSSPPPPDPSFTVTLEELGVVAEVQLRWTRGASDPGSSGLGLEITDFVQGAGAFERYVERNSSKSGEHKLSWPSQEELEKLGDPAGDDDPDA
jgi:hypothetical protein